MLCLSLASSVIERFLPKPKLSVTRENTMKRIVLFLAICAVTIVGNGSPNRAFADDLDSRLAELAKKNVDLKKMLRIEALERENLALSQKLDVPAARDRTRDAAVTTEKPRKESAVYNAMAADYPTKAERYAPREVLAPQWAGPYLGLHAGMGFGKWPTSISSVSSGTGSPTTASTGTDNSSSSGGLAGLHAGYLWQIGAFVFGPELDLDVGTVGSKSTIPTSFFQNFGGGFSSSQTVLNANSATLKWLSTLRGRVGVAAGDWLFFGTGGLAAAGLDLEANSPFFSTTNANSQVVFGYAAGGGLEYAFGPNARLRVEYLYYGFPEKSASAQSSSSSTCNTCIPPSTFTSTNTTSISVKPSTNVVRAGINWRFN
jgi:opacity protein-like surface antigen